MQLRDFKQAEQYLASFVPAHTSLFPGQIGLGRIRRLLGFLNNPQNKLKVVHVAGTSGKGSTAYLISLVLASQGFKTGLALSPHVLDVRERVQLDNELISKEKFIQYMNEIAPAIEKMKESEFGAPSYFEILVALAFYVFREEKVDFAIIETGLGGTFDGTNCVDREDKIAVITKIGFDHTKILGNKLSLIAGQKAGIIGKKNLCVSVSQKPSAEKIIREKSREAGGELFLIRQGKTFKNIKLTEGCSLFDFSFDGVEESKIQLGLLGEHQVENASLALSVISQIAKREKFLLDFERIRKALASASLVGRFDRKRINGKEIILDGAHNPQKIISLVSALKSLFPKEKFNFLLAIKHGKDYKSMIKLLIPIAKKFYLTEFFNAKQDSVLKSVDVSVLANTLENSDFKNYKTFLFLEKGLDSLLSEKNAAKIVITGSLYLLGEIYKKILKPYN